MNPSIYELRVKAELHLVKIEEEIRELLNREYGKPYELECRIKTEESLLRKYNEFSELCKEQVSNVPDILGFRISVVSQEDCPLIAELVVNNLKSKDVIDYFNSPKETGFKAYLCYLENQPVTTEIQIMSQAMRDWTNLTHKEHEIRKYGYTLNDNETKQSKK